LKLNDVSKFNLNRIADSIIKFLNKTTKEKIKIQDELTENKNSMTETSGSNQASSPKSIKSETTPPKNSVSSNETDLISKELNSSSITQDQLNAYKGKFPHYNKSIILYLDFWVNVKSNNSQSDFKDLLRKINNDPTLNKSQLEKFLVEICNNNGVYNKFSITAGKANCKTLEELKNKIK
jgi:hypothetical protein